MQLIATIFVISLGIAVGEEVANKSTPECGENEEYQECGTACPQTCQVWFPSACDDVCFKGCFCKTGFLRQNLNGKCIPMDSCEGSCRENEAFDSCGNGCPDTCLERDKPCVLMCCPGCYCEKGYILNDTTQICVKEEECALDII